MILITGAAGNLGSLLARHLIAGQHRVRLMYHRTPLPVDLTRTPGVESVRADLADPESVAAAVAGAGAIVHFAGVLFKPRPERFSRKTNTHWFSNLWPPRSRRTCEGSSSSRFPTLKDQRLSNGRQPGDWIKRRSPCTPRRALKKNACSLRRLATRTRRLSSFGWAWFTDEASS